MMYYHSSLILNHLSFTFLICRLGRKLVPISNSYHENWSSMLYEMCSPDHHHHFPLYTWFLSSSLYHHPFRETGRRKRVLLLGNKLSTMFLATKFIPTNWFVPKIMFWAEKNAHRSWVSALHVRFPGLIPSFSWCSKHQSISPEQCSRSSTPAILGVAPQIKMMMMIVMWQWWYVFHEKNFLAH